MAKSSRIVSKNLTNQIIGALADAFKTHPITIERWVAANDDRMSSDKAKTVLAQWNLTWINGEVVETKQEAIAV